MKKTLLILTFLVISLQSIAQTTFPVQLTPQVIPPYPIYVSDYANTNFVQDKVRLQVVLNDITINTNEIRLKLYLQGEGIAAQSKDFVVGATPIFIEGGIPIQLGTSELAPYFEFQNLQGITPNTYGNALPEGVYQICFEAYDAMTNNVLSAKTCSTIVLFQNDPPFLNLPLNGSGIQEQNPLNIVFQWTPRHINVSNVQYEFSLVEIWDNYIDPQAAFLSTPPIFQTTLTGTTLIYGPAFPQLLTGKKYAWNVRAFALDGAEEIGLFTNQGNSEIFWFTFQTPCDAPLFPEVEELSDHHAKLTWQGDSAHIDYTIKYREKNANSEWYELSTPREYITISDLKLETSYEYKIQGNCDYGSFGDTIIYEFITLSEQASAYIGCNIEPDPVDFSNQTLLPELVVNDIFTAGDFPITVLELNQSYTPSSGEGFVVVPWLGDTKIKVTFTDIYINTDFQLVEGIVKTYYDANWNNIVEIPDSQDVIDLIEIFGDEEDIVYQDPGNTNTTLSNTDTNTNNTDTGNTNTDTGNTNTDTSNTNTGIGNTNTETGNTNTETGNTETNNTQTTNETSSVFIVYNGQEYSDGDIIEVPYNVNQTNFAFLLKDYPENATFNWQVLSIGTDVTVGYAQNETIHDNLGIDSGNKQILDIVANYNDEKITVTLKRRSLFAFQNLLAIPSDNTKRKAYHGETLYLINHSFSNKRNIDYGVVTNPNLPNSAISSQDIAWYYNGNNLGENFGKRNLHLSLTKNVDDDFLVAVEAGNPNVLNKNINVKWVDRDYSKSTFSIGSDAHPLIKKAFEATKMIDGVSTFLDRIPFFKRAQENEILSTKIGWYFTIIPFEQTIVNKEDDSRLYFTEKKTKGGFKLGLKGGIKYTVWGIPYDKLPLPDWAINKAKDIITAEVNLVLKANAKGEIMAESIERKFVESEEWIDYKSSINPAAVSLSMSGGVEGVFGILQSNEWFAVSGNASGLVNAEIISIGWRENEFGIYPLRDGVNLDLKASAYIRFLGKKLETETFYERIEIISPF